MNDDSTPVAELKRLVLRFTQERDWEQFHHPKDLGVALAIEVGELLEHFRYLTNEQITERLGNPELKTELSHELADCLFLILRLADVCAIDLASSLETKVALAALKYPIDKVHGKSFKYTHYEETA